MCQRQMCWLVNETEEGKEREYGGAAALRVKWMLMPSRARASDFPHKARVHLCAGSPYIFLREKLWSLTSQYYLAHFPLAPFFPPFLCAGWRGGGGVSSERTTERTHICKEFGAVRTADNPKSLTTDKTANLT